MALVASLRWGDQGRPRITCTVEGQQFDCLVDTGAEVSVLPIKAKKGMSMEIEGMGGGVTRGKLSDPMRVQTGDICRYRLISSCKAKEKRERERESERQREEIEGDRECLRERERLEETEAGRDMERKGWIERVGLCE